MILRDPIDLQKSKGRNELAQRGPAGCEWLEETLGQLSQKVRPDSVYL